MGSGEPLIPGKFPRRVSSKSDHSIPWHARYREAGFPSILGRIHVSFSDALAISQGSIGMLIELELNTNDAEALLRHCDAYEPCSGDYRDDSRLAGALETLASAIKEGMDKKESMESVESQGSLKN
jgi:hypothetical protein